MKTEKELVKKGLELAYEAISELGEEASEVVQEGTFGALVGDAEIGADKKLGLILFDHFDAMKDAVRVTVEGHPQEKNEEKAGLWVCVDPLDASLNYRQRRGSMGLPYSTCITVLAKARDAKFSDVIAAGIIDLRCRDIWLSHGGHAYLNGRGLHHERENVGVDQLDLGSQIIIGEFYYPENRERLVRAFSEKKGWLRNPGSAAYEMALVSSGSAVAYICDRQKQHELGAGYALVKGAGGVAVDFDGQDLGEHEYLFNAQTPCVLAVNWTIAKQILELLNK